MTARLLFVRRCTQQYDEYNYQMETECKTIVVDLPNMDNSRYKGQMISDWQIVGYEEIKDSEETD